MATNASTVPDTSAVRLSPSTASDPMPAAALHSTEPTPPFDQAHLREAVLRASRILSEGGPHASHRAAKAIRSDGLAPLTDDSFRQLDALHPPEDRISALPHDRAPGVVSLEKVLDKVIMHRVNNGSAPGVSGWSGSHLAALWTRLSKEARDGLHLFIRDICNGVFTARFMQRLMACRLVLLAKGKGGIRPIAVMETFAKCAAHCAVALVEAEIPTLFPQIQYGVKRPGGSETAVHLIRNLLREAAEKDPSDACALAIDFRNAFNTVSRERVWQTLLKQSCLAPLLKAFYVQYSDPTPLFVYDRGHLVKELRSRRGVRQGCPFAALAFALTVQPLYEAALAQVPAERTTGVAIQDDFTAVGTVEHALTVLDYMRTHCHEYGLELRTDKCQLYVPVEVQRAMGKERLRQVHTDCAARGGIPVTSHLDSLGVMHATDGEVAAFCDGAVRGSEFFFAALAHPDMPVQHALLLLR